MDISVTNQPVDSHKLKQKRLLKNRLFVIAIGLFSSLIFIPILHIFLNIIRNSLPLKTVATLSLESPLVYASIGSLIMISIATLIAVPICIAAGIYLSEYAKTSIARILSLLIGCLLTTPTIIIGMIVYTWIVTPMHSFSGLSGSCALALLMSPSLVHAIKEANDKIPKSIKKAAYALGAPFYKVIWHVNLPLIKSHLRNSLSSTLSKISGETVPLMLTAFGSGFLTLNPLDPMESLPLLIFKNAMMPDTYHQQMAWTGGLLLCTLIATISIAVRSPKDVH